MEEVLSAIAANLTHSFETPRGVVAFIANVGGLGLLVVASFVRTMVPLRTMTVASNVLLLISGVLALSPIHMLLYLGLIPLNTYRLVEIKRLTRKVEKASRQGDLSGLWLKPYMKPRSLPAGAVLFHRGDDADSMYLLLEGRLELVEIGKQQEVGELFGEISFFSPDRKRTLTARCVTGCLILGIAEPAFKQLYFQHPKFAFQISNLIAARLSADLHRKQGQLDALRRELDARAAAPANQPQPLDA